MRPNIGPKSELDTKRVIEKIVSVLSSLTLDNFKYKKISGVTDLAPDTQKLFKHNLLKTPQLVIPQTGDIYIYSIDPIYLDIRSRQASSNFTVILIG